MQRLQYFFFTVADRVGFPSYAAVAAAAAIAFDSRNPAKSMMSVNFNKLGLSDVVNTVVVKKVRNAIPKKTMETLEKIFMKYTFFCKINKIF